MKSEDGQFPVLRSCCWPKGWEGHQELGKRALAVAHVTRDPYGPHPHIPTSRNGAAMAPQQNGMTNAWPCLRCADISYQTELLKRCLESWIKHVNETRRDLKALPVWNKVHSQMQSQPEVQSEHFFRVAL